MRSLLFAPGNHARRVEKALGLPADGVILDLEDAVAISEKISTRATVQKVFGEPRAGKLYIRVNALTTEWCYGDLVAVVQLGLDGIILPKVEHANDLRTAEWLIENLERERNIIPGWIDLIPIIETALGISNLSGICRSGTRTKCLAFGAGDFTLDMGMVWTCSEAELLPHRVACVLELRSRGDGTAVGYGLDRFTRCRRFRCFSQAGGGIGLSGQDVHPS